MLCHLMGVPMPSWHTAVGDAEATGRLLASLLALADRRQLGARLRIPSLFPGNLAQRPTLSTRGRLLPRDPSIFPPIGQQPGDVEPLDVERGAVSVTLDLESLLNPDLRAKIAAATDRLEELNGGPFDETEWHRASRVPRGMRTGPQPASPLTSSPSSWAAAWSRAGITWL